MKQFLAAQAIIPALGILSLGTILLVTPQAQAQEYSECYLVNQAGRVVDLSSICGISAPEPEIQPQTTQPQFSLEPNTSVIPVDFVPLSAVNPYDSVTNTVETIDSDSEALDSTRVNPTTQPRTYRDDAIDRVRALEVVEQAPIETTTVPVLDGLR